ncbi:hypothetical protein G4Y79_04735 [Phototrophicus methaneseepsis]|uniref:Uncharacterized protein n=1 Tax=Phototrophicus methaneseepsis TaxID=2710758 RepID=A0A7S8EB26_9CHLR|nr:hypothetical protein [Phototrophicus methaneseepsis]QPC83692.1 hypothetical protein G4Y79_04735 [Phototrophicus methaneseepsis]
MKLSIWQEFSSNHSADFTVVGAFESVSAAEQAAANIQKILDRIEAWWNNLTREEMMAWGQKTETEQLTPIEAELQKQLNVTWSHSLNWFYWHNFRKPLYKYQNFVFVTNPNLGILNGPQPFDELLKDYGASVYKYVSESRTHANSILVMDVECHLPIEPEAAELLYEGFREDFETLHQHGWQIYEEAYSPNIDLPFDIIYYDLESDDSEPRMFRVARNENRLNLWGIMLYLEENEEYAGKIRLLIDYFTKEGCTNITISFRSIPNPKYPD